MVRLNVSLVFQCQKWFQNVISMSVWFRNVRFGFRIASNVIRVCKYRVCIGVGRRIVSKPKGLSQALMSAWFSNVKIGSKNVTPMSSWFSNVKIGFKLNVCRIEYI